LLTYLTACGQTERCNEGRERAELLEAFNCILDVLGVPDADGDVFEPEENEA
jgi:hypothetical protein